MPANCVNIEAAYIIGDYHLCARAVISRNAEPECRYLKALCLIGNSEYDAARFILAELSSSVGRINDVVALSLNSLGEIAFIKGDYTKAQDLTNQTNRLLSDTLPNSYPYVVSELLLVRSYFDSKDALSALRRIEMIKTLNTDGYIYESLNTNIH